MGWAGDGVNWGFGNSVGWEFDKVVRVGIKGGFGRIFFLCLMNFSYELICVCVL